MQTSRAVQTWPVLSTEGVEVVAAPLDVQETRLQALERTLSTEELRRAQRLRGMGARRFVARRGILRALIAERLGIPAAVVQLEAGPDGKLTGAGGVLFSVSHSKDLSVFAFSRIGRVGVDVEHVRPLVDFGAAVEVACAPQEAGELESLPARDRLDAFFACWTRKEAYLKARGTGLDSPREVAVSLLPQLPARVVSVAGAPHEPVRWQLTAFEPRPGWIGAVAVERAA